MASVYSALLLQGTIPFPGHITYTVPAGFRAVVRDIVALRAAAQPGSSAGFFVLGPGSDFIYAVTAPKARNGVTFHWEGHQIVDVGGLITAAAEDDSWNVKVSGYLLTLP